MICWRKYITISQLFIQGKKLAISIFSLIVWNEKLIGILFRSINENATQWLWIIKIYSIIAHTMIIICSLIIMSQQDHIDVFIWQRAQLLLYNLLFHFSTMGVPDFFYGSPIELVRYIWYSLTYGNRNLNVSNSIRSI